MRSHKKYKRRRLRRKTLRGGDRVALPTDVVRGSSGVGSIYSSGEVPILVETTTLPPTVPTAQTAGKAAATALINSQTAATLNSIVTSIPATDPVYLAGMSTTTTPEILGLNEVTLSYFSNSISGGFQWISGPTAIISDISKIFPNFKTTNYFQNNMGYAIIFNFMMYWMCSDSAWGLTFNIFNSAGVLQRSISTSVDNPQTITQQITLLNTDYFTVFWSRITHPTGKTRTNYTINIKIVPTYRISSTNIPSISVFTAQLAEAALRIITPPTGLVTPSTDPTFRLYAKLIQSPDTLKMLVNNAAEGDVYSSAMIAYINQMGTINPAAAAALATAGFVPTSGGRRKMKTARKRRALF